MRTKNFKINIGETFKDDKRNITIIDRKYKYYNNKTNRKFKFYQYKCNECGWDEGWIDEYNLLKGIGCSCCKGKIVVKGINDISTTNPELIKYFVNTEEAYTHSIGSDKKVLCKCPCCGYEKEISISNLYYQGISCPICSDGFSYPEKFMVNFLNQLKQNNQLNDFIYQYTSKNNKWCGKYKYDFYFIKNEESYIIETHGIQHYEKSFKKIDSKTLEEEQENDKIKFELAIDNGIKLENYITIDCRKSDLEHIKNNIINSKLNEIFDLSKINWIEIGQYSEKSLVKEVCNYWYIHNNINNAGLTTKDLEKVFKLGKTTIIRYLKKGTKLGWCYYNPKEEMNKNNKINAIKNGRNLSKQVEIFKDEISLGIFPSCHELERQSEKLFGIVLKSGSISEVAKNNGRLKKYKGFTFKYVS